jgi:hypothetical protein
MAAAARERQRQRLESVKIRVIRGQNFPRSPWFSRKWGREIAFTIPAAKNRSDRSDRSVAAGIIIIKNNSLVINHLVEIRLIRLIRGLNNRYGKGK